MSGDRSRSAAPPRVSVEIGTLSVSGASPLEARRFSDALQLHLEAALAQRAEAVAAPRPLALERHDLGRLTGGSRIDAMARQVAQRIAGLALAEGEGAP